jgi:hypothetical protein
MDFLATIKLPDTTAVSGFALNAWQTVGDNINDIGTKIQNSQIADKIKQTINGETPSVDTIDRKRADKNEKKRLTEHIDESDDDEIRIDVGSAREGWYTDNGGKVEEPSVLSRFTSFFDNSTKSTPPPPPTRVEPPPPPPPQPATWQDSFSSTFGSWRTSLEDKISSIRNEQPPEEQGWWAHWTNRIDNAISLTSQQRLYGFIASLVTGIVFILISVAFLPYVLVMAKAFAVFYTFGNVFLLLSVCFVVGPVQQIKNMFQSNRVIASAIYVFSMIMTLIAALVVCFIFYYHLTFPVTKCSTSIYIINITSLFIDMVYIELCTICTEIDYHVILECEQIIILFIKIIKYSSLDDH